MNKTVHTMRISTLFSCLKSSAGYLLLIAMVLAVNGCSPKKLSCTKLKNGVFFLNPHREKDTYIIRREGTIQKEVVQGRTDTSYFDVQWRGECSYVLKFKEGGSFTGEEKEFVLNHNVRSNITSLGKDYYIIKSTMEGKLASDLVLTDTIWVKKLLPI